MEQSKRLTSDTRYKLGVSRFPLSPLLIAGLGVPKTNLRINYLLKDSWNSQSGFTERYFITVKGYRLESAKGTEVSAVVKGVSDRR